MSACCVFTPVVVDMAWPILSSVIASAVTSLGYEMAVGRTEEKTSTTNRIELTVKQSRGFEESLGEQEELTVQRGMVRLTFRKGADGKLKICASGQDLSDEELKAAGTEAMNGVLQAYVREKVTTELKRKGFAVQEEKLPDGTIRLQVKNWA